MASFTIEPSADGCLLYLKYIHSEANVTYSACGRISLWESDSVEYFWLYDQVVALTEKHCTTVRLPTVDDSLLALALDLGLRVD